MERATPITLRVATVEDTEFFFVVYAATRLEELAVTGWSEHQKEQFCRMQFTAQAMHYRQSYLTAEYFVIKRGGVPVGRLYVARRAREICILDIAILPEYRSQGIGTQLLRELQNEAAHTAKALSIHVERFNPALRLYQHLGFQIIEDKGVYFLLAWSPAAELR